MFHDVLGVLKSALSIIIGSAKSTMKYLKGFMVGVSLLTAHIFFTVVVVDLYHKHLKRKSISDPVLSIYEMINSPIGDFLEERDAYLSAYFAKDKRLYANKSDAYITNLFISFPVEYKDYMRNCIDSYVFIESKIKYSRSKDSIVFYDFERFSKAEEQAVQALPKKVDDLMVVFNANSERRV